MSPWTDSYSLTLVLSFPNTSDQAWMLVWYKSAGLDDRQKLTENAVETDASLDVLTIERFGISIGQTGNSIRFERNLARQAVETLVSE